jgi:hypothetical protein
VILIGLGVESIEVDAFRPLSRLPVVCDADIPRRFGITARILSRIPEMITLSSSSTATIQNAIA